MRPLPGSHPHEAGSLVPAWTRKAVALKDLIGCPQEIVLSRKPPEQPLDQGFLTVTKAEVDAEVGVECLEIFGHAQDLSDPRRQVLKGPGAPGLQEAEEHCRPREMWGMPDCVAGGQSRKEVPRFTSGEAQFASGLFSKEQERRMDCHPFRTGQRARQKPDPLGGEDDLVDLRATAKNARFPRLQPRLCRVLHHEGGR